jgi:hypothetical protein
MTIQTNRYSAAIFKPAVQVARNFAGRVVLLALSVAAAFYGATFDNVTAAPQAPAANGYITGTVRSPQGPEAGVWVIAETRDLQTPFIHPA